MYVEHALGAGQAVALTREQAHYLFSVMRLSQGARVALFNGRDGEWQAEVSEIGRKGGLLTCREASAAQSLPPDLWLLFAPVKKARTDFIVEKAVEMGVRRILPVLTRHSNSDRIRGDRLQAHAREAAEQCGAVFVPEVAPLERLDRVLGAWDPARALVICDEALTGAPATDPAGASEPGALLVGPEGGFSEAERTRFGALGFARRMSLGPRILRADTAAVAALALWQIRAGDWR